MSISFYQFPSSQVIYWHLEKDPLVAIVRENQQITHEISHLLDLKFVPDTVLKDKINLLVQKHFSQVPLNISKIYSDHLYNSVKECSTYQAIFRSKL